MSTQKQRLAAARITENHGNISKTMREVGYSANTAKKPSNLTNSKGWQELMEKVLPDELLTRKHRQLLNKKEMVIIGRGKDREAFPTKEIDAGAVAKGLDLAYKVKGKYTTGKHQVDNEIKVVEVVMYRSGSMNKYGTKKEDSNTGR